MLATLGGTLALLLGLTVLLLPLLASELSRPRDSAWGAVVLLLGLVLVTSAERLTGSPMLAVLCGGLLIGRLGTEVGLARWRQLTPEERQRLGSTERWRSSFSQLGASGAGLLQSLAGRAEGLGGIVAGLGSWLGERRRPKPITKKWVRPEEAGTSAEIPVARTEPAAAPEPGAEPEPDPTTEPEPEPEPELAPEPAPTAISSSDQEPTVVRDFGEIDALLAAAGETASPAGGGDQGEAG